MKRAAMIAKKVLMWPRGHMILLALPVLLIAACSSSDNEAPKYMGPVGSSSGAGGFLGTGLTAGDDARATSGVGVNGFLWRATLDTIAFMPLSSADPFGGVIITDWYASPQSPDERFKINVFILDRQLRADGLKVAVFRQQKKGTSGWSDSPVSADTGAKLENAILTRARQLRINAVTEENS